MLQLTKEELMLVESLLTSLIHEMKENPKGLTIAGRITLGDKYRTVNVLNKIQICKQELYPVEAP